MTILYNAQTFTSRRKQLRNTLTPAEAGLWKYLKGSKLKERKFRRQYGIGNCIVDFYCPSEKIAIELDGEVHRYDKINKQDREKERYLNSLGIKLLRFENKLVFEHLEVVLKRICETFYTTPSDITSETPPYKGGELISLLINRSSPPYQGGVPRLAGGGG